MFTDMNYHNLFCLFVFSMCLVWCRIYVLLMFMGTIFHVFSNRQHEYEFLQEIYFDEIYTNL